MTPTIADAPDNPLAKIARRFHERFAGLPRAYGRTRMLATQTALGKQQVACDTVREPLTTALWMRHLAGTDHLGVVPIRDDTTCTWGAIDIDSYKDFDLIKLADHVRRLELPLIVCRTKSGGAHLYCFTSEPVPAELMRGKLMEWAIALGHSGVEVFPKQTRLANDQDVGNWINMPYQGGDDTTRYAVGIDGKLLCHQFLDLADLMALSRDDLQHAEPSAVTQFQEEFKDAPPCLASLAVRGFGEGSRNNALFNVGVYLRKRFGDDEWEQHIDTYNQKFMTPPLPSSEVQKVVKQVKTKNYFYKCGDMPINAVCNKQICLTKLYGIGRGSGDPGVVFGSLQKITTEPPIWILNVDGANIELTTAELKDQMRFGTKCMDVLNKLPLPIRAADYNALIREKLKTVEVIAAPPEASLAGTVMALLEEYCTTGAQARSRDELLMKKPWTEHGHTYFVATHFRAWLAQTARITVGERELWSIVRKHDGEPAMLKIKGKSGRYWRVPAFAVQTEDFIIPELPKEAF